MKIYFCYLLKSIGNHFFHGSVKNWRDQEMFDIFILHKSSYCIKTESTNQISRYEVIPCIA